MSQEEKKQTAPETEAAAEKPETPAQEAPEKEAPQTEEKNEGKHDCKHHHHETAALQAKLEAEEKKSAELKDQLLRTAAEYDNYRKRSQREADQKFNDGISHAVPSRPSYFFVTLSRSTVRPSASSPIATQTPPAPTRTTRRAL